LYQTTLGAAYVGDAASLLPCIADQTVDLVLTSPPFALQRQKAYGNEDQATYVDWLLGFCADVQRVLKPTGSFVLDLGGAYQRVSLSAHCITTASSYAFVMNLASGLQRNSFGTT